MKRGELLDKSKEIISKDRAATHGEAENSFQDIADYWNVYLKHNKLMDIGCSGITPLDVSMMMSLFKVARTDSNKLHADNWLDLVGYSAIAGEMALNSKPTVKIEKKQVITVGIKSVRSSMTPNYAIVEAFWIDGKACYETQPIPLYVDNNVIIPIGEYIKLNWDENKQAWLLPVEGRVYGHDTLEVTNCYLDRSNDPEGYWIRTTSKDSSNELFMRRAKYKVNDEDGKLILKLFNKVKVTNTNGVYLDFQHATDGTYRQLTQDARHRLRTMK